MIANGHTTGTPSQAHDERMIMPYPTTIQPAEFTDVLVTVHFSNAAVELNSYGLKDSHELVEAAKASLARHFGPCAFDYVAISDRRNVSDLVSWAGPDADTDAFYLRATGEHGWFNKASWKITQTG